MTFEPGQVATVVLLLELCLETLLAGRVLVNFFEPLGR